jgi:hypothetical protein
MFVPDLRVWTSSLAGTTSPNSWLDTLVGLYCMRIPAGTYQMGSTSVNLAPVGSWLRLLNCGGISGPVTLRADFTNNVLVNQLIDLGNIPGASATNTLTLDGQGDTLRMTSNSTEVATIRLTESKNISIRNFVIVGTGANVSLQIWMHNVDTVSIVNNRFWMEPSIPYNTSIQLSNTSNINTASRSTALRIDSNQFLGSIERAIFINGIPNSPSRRLQIRYNLVQPTGEGIIVSCVDTAWISHNDISMPNGRSGSNTASGIFLLGTNGEIHINHNRIHGFKRILHTSTSQVRAIQVSGLNITGKSFWVYNNLIYDIGTSGIQVGIFSSILQGDIAFNTIHLNDTFSRGEAMGIQITKNGNGLRLYGNNIVIDKRQGTLITAIRYETNPASANFNNYFVRFRGPSHQLIRTNTGSFNTLAAFRQAFPLLDSVSSEEDPFFENPATGQYAPNAIGLYRNVQPLPYVTTDFNNRARPSTPSRGAIEDSVFEQETALEAYLGLSGSNCNVIGLNTQLATFHNLGSATIDSVVVSYRRNQGTWIRDTVFLNVSGRQQLSYPLGRGNLFLSGNDTVSAVAISHYGTTLRRDSLRIITPNNFRPILTVPFLNPFENAGSLNNYCVVTNPLSVVQVMGTTLVTPLIGQSSLGMSAGSDPSFWVNANSSNAWLLNPQYLSEVTFFVDPVRTGPLRLAMRLSTLGSTGHNFFRILVNDMPVRAEGLSDPTITFLSSAQRSLLYQLDSINTGAPLKITMQSSVRYDVNHSPRHVNLIDSLALFFAPDVSFSGLSTFSDTLCDPLARQVQVQAMPTLGATIASVNLRYSADGGPWNSIPMTIGTAVNSYRATLPAVAGAQRIRYTVVALVGTQDWSSDTAEFYNYPFHLELGPGRNVLSGLSTILRPQLLQVGTRSLRITELMYFRSGSNIQTTFPPGISSSIDEFIEVANYGDDSVDLREAEIAISSSLVSLVTYRFPHGAILPPKGRAVVAIAQGVDNLTNGIYFFAPPINTNQFFLSNQTGAVVLREAGSKQPIDGLMINGTVFPTQLGFPAGIWSGSISGSGTSGLKRTNVNAFDNTAWFLNTAGNPSNIGTIDSAFRVGPTGSQIRWRDINGQLIGTGDSLVVTPTSNTFVRVEVDWYGCTRHDFVNLFLVPNNRVDLAITNIIQPPAVDTFLISTPLATSIRIKNLGNLSSGNVLVELLANGGVVASTNISQGIAANDSLVVTLPAWLPAQGAYNLCFRLSTTADTITANNILCRNNIYFATSTSIEDLNSSKLRVFPIPTNNQLFIKLGESNQTIDHNQWQAIDAAGRIIPLNLIATTGDNLITLEISTLSDGFYFLQNTSDRSIKPFKFIVRQ